MQFPASAAPSNSAPAPSTERDRIIARLRCIRGSTFTSARGIKGRIEWDGLRRIDTDQLVPFDGIDQKTGIHYCTLDALREVIRENEAHIEHATWREEISLGEFLKRKPEYRKKLGSLPKGLVPKTQPAPQSPARPASKRPEPIIEEVGFPEPEPPADSEIPF